MSLWLNADQKQVRWKQLYLAKKKKNTVQYLGRSAQDLKARIETATMEEAAFWAAFYGFLSYNPEPTAQW